MATEGESSKLVWWIMGVLLMLTMAAGGWWAKDLQARFDVATSTTSQKIEGLHQTNALRGERLVAAETRLATLEPRITSVEGQLGAIVPRIPLLESRISGLDNRLQRIEEKLDRLLSAKGGGR